MSVCVCVFLVIQHATRMRPIILPSVPCLHHTFHIISQTVRFSGKITVFKHKTCRYFLHNFHPESFFFLRRIQQDSTKCIHLHIMHLLLLSYFDHTDHILMKLKFSPIKFSENTQISNFMKILPAGSELFM